MSLRLLATDRFSDCSSLSSIDNRNSNGCNYINLIGNVVVCQEINPFLVNDESDSIIECHGNIQDLFLFGNESDFDVDHYRNHLLFSVIYYEKYNSNLRHLKRNARLPCKNELGGKEVKCKCLSVLRYNETLLYQTTEMMTSFQICKEGPEIVKKLGIDVDFSESKVAKFVEGRLQSLKLYSGGTASTPLSKMKGKSYGKRGGAKRWNLFKFVEEHFPTTIGRDSEYKYVCTNAMLKIFNLTKQNWEQVLVKEGKEPRVNKKKSPSRKNDSRSSPRLKKMIEVNYLEEDTEDENDSFKTPMITSKKPRNELRKSIKKNGIKEKEMKSSMTITPEKTDLEKNLSDYFV